MTAIAIDRFHARYRLPQSAGQEQDRLRRLLAAVLDSGLEAAVQRSGIDAGGELCIREVSAFVRLSLGESDTVLKAKLALALVGAIESGAAGAASTGFVRYTSRAHALLDLTRAAMAGDLTRAWAWRSLGLWDAGAAAPAPDAARAVLRALIAEPRHAPATLAHLAGEPALFARLLSLAPPPLWLALSRAVLAAAGAGKGETAPAMPSRAGTARRLAERSAIARAAVAARAAGWTADERRVALAALALCEAEPALLRTAGIGTVVEVVAAEMAEMAAPLESHPSLPSSFQASKNRERIGRSEPGDARWRSSPDSRGSDGGARRDLDQLPEWQRPADEDGAVEEPLFLPPGVRRRGRTRFGGLLFLIHPVGRLGLAERIAREPRLAERGPRWGLHQLAMALLPVAADDPTALAFAGLLPGDEPPGAEEPAPSAAEMAAVLEMRGDLLHALRTLLDRPREPEAALLDFVCRRDATIVADPGWLEVHLALDDVRTEIRAAGLDLDPGWVPWLGLVVRLVYG